MSIRVSSTEEALSPYEKIKRAFQRFINSSPRVTSEEGRYILNDEKLSKILTQAVHDIKNDGKVKTYRLDKETSKE